MRHQPLPPDHPTSSSACLSRSAACEARLRVSLSPCCLTNESVERLRRLKRPPTPSQKKRNKKQQVVSSLVCPLALSLAATVSCLVCSESSGTPPGKMRGLITVKLANEQVNYRSKFLYKKCHFAERCSSSPPLAQCLKKRERKGGREGAGEWLFLLLFSPLLLLLLLLFLHLLLLL